MSRALSAASLIGIEAALASGDEAHLDLAIRRLLLLAFTVLAGPLFDLADAAATDMLDRTPYIASVLDEAAAERAAETLSHDPTEVHDARH